MTSAAPQTVGRRRRRAARGTACTAAALGLGLIGACARPGPPPGGPADSTPPEVTRTLPADGETWVDRTAAVEIEFSEEMDRQSVERALALAPEVDLKRVRWEGRVMLVEPEEALPDSTTFVCSIAEAAKDYHGVRMARAFSFAFSTGGAIDAGTLTGTVTVQGEPVGGAVVWVCEGDVTADTLGVVTPCDYSTATSEEGAFSFSNVRSSDLAYSLVAFVDRNANGRYETGAEAGWIVPNAARIDAPGDSVGGLTVEMQVPAGQGGRRGAPREE